jgi:hypothetical protein
MRMATHQLRTLLLEDLLPHRIIFTKSEPESQQDLIHRHPLLHDIFMKDDWSVEIVHFLLLQPG